LEKNVPAGERNKNSNLWQRTAITTCGMATRQNSLAPPSKGGRTPKDPMHEFNGLGERAGKHLQRKVGRNGQ